MNLFDFTLKKIDWWLLTSIWTLTNYTLRVLKIYDRSGYLDTKENFSTCDFSECTRRVLSIYCVFGAPIWIQILNHELEQSTHRALILTLLVFVYPILTPGALLICHQLWWRCTCSWSLSHASMPKIRSVSTTIQCVAEFHPHALHRIQYLPSEQNLFQKTNSRMMVAIRRLVMGKRTMVHQRTSWLRATTSGWVGWVDPTFTVTCVYIGSVCVYVCTYLACVSIYGCLGADYRPIKGQISNQWPVR